MILQARTYCGFSLDNKIKRVTLKDSEILQEVAELKKMGFDHVLLVTGEANYTVNINYFLNAIDLIKQDFSNISVEVQPLSIEEYIQLHEAGVYSVLVYQETYHKEVYNIHQRYLNDLRLQKLFVNSTVVIKYVNELHPSLLMYSLNYQMRKRNIDTIVSNSE